MQVARLLALGFDSVVGKIDRRGKNYGFIRDDGTAALTPEGEELVADLESVTDVAFREVPASGGKAPKASKAAKVKADAPVAPTADEADLLGSLGEQLGQ